MKNSLVKLAKSTLLTILPMVMLLISFSLAILATPFLFTKLAYATPTYEVWAGAAGQDKVFCLTDDTNYVYAGLHRDSTTEAAKVVKIAKSTMTTSLVWTGIIGEGYAHAMIEDGDHIYVGLHSKVTDEFAGIIKKILKSDMSVVDTWTGTVNEHNVHGMTQDDDYIYAAMNNQDGTEGKVIKIAKATFTTSLAWTGGGVPDAVNHTMVQVTDDIDYVYACKYTSVDVGTVYKITKATMVLDSTWTGAAGQTNTYGLGSDSDYLYTGHNLAPAQMVKIDKTTMTTDSSWTGAVGENQCLWVIPEDVYVYAALQTTPFKTLGIDKSTMTTSASVVGVTDDKMAHALAVGEDYIYTGLNISPAKVIKTPKDFGIEMPTHGALTLAGVLPYIFLSICIMGIMTTGMAEGGVGTLVIVAISVVIATVGITIILGVLP